MHPAPPGVGEARHFVARTLQEWGCVGEPTDVVVLLTSELVTNAVLHARSEIDVLVTNTPHAVRVAVRDESDALPMLRDHDAEAMTGRGLALVDALATDWGVERGAAGKTVWFEVGV